jgi:hypothetical protein
VRSIVNGKESKVGLMLAAGLLAVGIAAVPAAWAGKGSEISAGQVVEVVGRVELAGSPATIMVLVEKDRKQYLYMGQGTSAGLSVVDVTNFRKARVIGRAAASLPAATGAAVPLGDTRAMILTAPDHSAMSGADGAEPQTVTILDVQDPASPTVARVFRGVTSLVTDHGRGLIYVANAEGLWIVKARDEASAVPALAEEQDD